jgi:hypothetical protein
MTITRARFIHFAAALLVAVALAQTSANAAPSLDERVQERTQKLAEQHKPRTAVPFDPAQFDKYVGLYQAAPYEFFTVMRHGEHFILGVRVGGKEEPIDMEIYPESPTKFFAKAKPIQISFVVDGRGKVTGFVQHASGFEIDLPKVDESVEKRATAALAARIKNKTPRPGTEGMVRRFIEGVQHGQPNYDEMRPSSAVIYRMDLLQKYVDDLQKLGALRSLTFTDVTPRGEDRYLAVYEHGRADMTIDLTAEGKIDSVLIGNIQTP